jgi:hypothetical protein
VFRIVNLFQNQGISEQTSCLETHCTQIKSLKGFGDYAAGSMCRLLGRFDRLGIDSSCRTMFRGKTNNDAPRDSEIAAWYEPFGEWAGLAIWMDVIREHLTSNIAKVAG